MGRDGETRVEEMTEKTRPAEIFTAVVHDDKTYCLGCFLDCGSNLEEAQPLDMDQWELEVPPKCSVCLQEQTGYIKTS